MGWDRCTAEVEILNAQGLHTRPAKLFVETASRFQSSVQVSKGGGLTVNGKSIMGLMSLLAPRGTVLRIEANGPDAEEAIAALRALVSRRFEEEAR